MIFAAIADRVILAWGWRRALTAFAAGALGALAMPPYNVLPALAVAMTVAVWLIDGSAAGSRAAAVRAAAAAGWWFGFGFFVAGLWWLGAAFLVDADEFAWALPLGVLGLPAALALFTAAGFALARAVWPAGARRILALAAGLAVADWLRGHILSGFPWNSFGMALGDIRPLGQAASVLGLYGLSLIAVAVAASPAVLATGATARARLTAPVLALAALAALAAFGAWRIPGGETPFVPDVKLRIMQPNLPQDAKFRPENADEIMRRYVALSDRATSPASTGVADVTHLVWPESAFPFLLARTPAALAQIAALLPPGTTLITGAARAGEGLPGEKARYFNAVHVIGDDGAILATYDKEHLVPFGEYLPLAGVLQRLGLRQFVRTPGGFSPGPPRAALTVRGLPRVAPLICYEAIFPGEVTPDSGRPGVLLNVTNDAWFSRTPGPYQHFAQARLRSVEEGLPLIRAANTGISAIIDAYGGVVASLPLGVEGVLDARLPAAIAPTIYARFGDAVFAIVLVFCFIGTLGSRKVNRVADGTGDRANDAGEWTGTKDFHQQGTRGGSSRARAPHDRRHEPGEAG